MFVVQIDIPTENRPFYLYVTAIYQPNIIRVSLGGSVAHYVNHLGREVSAHIFSRIPVNSPIIELTNLRYQPQCPFDVNGRLVTLNTYVKTQYLPVPVLPIAVPRLSPVPTRTRHHVAAAPIIVPIAAPKEVYPPSRENRYVGQLFTSIPKTSQVEIEVELESLVKNILGE